MRAFALDHLTVADTAPLELISIAAQTGYTSVCMFIEPLPVLPRMPAFQLIRDAEHCRQVRRQCANFGVSIDLVYPFTLTARREIETFHPALECAAFLGAKAVNVLLYDRDAVRRAERLEQFCEMASEYGLTVALEFYPLSQVQSLSAAVELVAHMPGKIGVNVDLLHLMRSVGDLAQLHEIPSRTIAYAQYCDGPAHMDPARLGWEASTQRLLPGAGVFDLRAFDRLIAQEIPVSLEIPQDTRIAAGVSVKKRAGDPLVAIRSVLARQSH